LSARLRASALLLASLSVSCADATTTPQVIRGQAALSARATSEVIEMLSDAKSRVADALDDTSARTELTAALDQMILGMGLGRLDVVERNATDVRAALGRAAEADANGAGDADRDAIKLALDAVDEAIADARQASGN
jgi:hypothetical protein